MESIEAYLDNLLCSIDILLKTEKECLIKQQFYNKIVELKDNLVQEYFYLNKIQIKLEFLKESSKNDLKVLIQNQFTNRIDYIYFRGQINDIKFEINKTLSVFDISSDHMNNLEKISELKIKYKTQEYRLNNLYLNEKDLTETIERLTQENEFLNRNSNQEIPKSNVMFQTESLKSFSNVDTDQQDFIPEYFILSDEYLDLENLSKQIKLDLKQRFFYLNKTPNKFKRKYKINLQNVLLDILMIKRIHTERPVYFFVVLSNDYYKIELDFSELQLNTSKKMDFTFVINNKLIDLIPFFKSNLIASKRISANKDDLILKLVEILGQFKEEHLITIDLINQAKDNIKLIQDFQNEAIQSYELTRKKNEEQVDILVEIVKTDIKEQTNLIINDRLNKINECKSKLDQIKEEIIDLNFNMNRDLEQIEEVEVKIKNYAAKMAQNTKEFFDSSKSIYFYILKIIGKFGIKVDYLAERQRMLESCLNKVCEALVTGQPIDYLSTELKKLI